MFLGLLLSWYWVAGVGAGAVLRHAGRLAVASGAHPATGRSPGLVTPTANVADVATRPSAFLAEHPAGRTVGWWGMVMFVTTEATLFAVLLSSYFYVRFQVGTWPPGGIEEPKLIRPLIMTAVLLPSSLPVMWAERGIAKGQRWRLRLGLVATLLMGGSFLALQGMEYAGETREVHPGPPTSTARSSTRSPDSTACTSPSAWSWSTGCWRPPCAAASATAATSGSGSRRSTGTSSTRSGCSSCSPSTSPGRL